MDHSDSFSSIEEFGARFSGLCFLGKGKNVRTSYPYLNSNFFVSNLDIFMPHHNISL